MTKYSSKWDVILKGGAGVWTVDGEPVVDVAEDVIRFQDINEGSQGQVVAIFPRPAVQSVIRQLAEVAEESSEYRASVYTDKPVQDDLLAKDPHTGGPCRCMK